MAETRLFCMLAWSTAEMYGLWSRGAFLYDGMHIGINYGREAFIFVCWYDADMNSSFICANMFVGKNPSRRTNWVGQMGALVIFAWMRTDTVPTADPGGQKLHPFAPAH